MKLFGVPYLIRNRVVEFEPERRIAWRHFTANRWRYELAPTADGGTTVTETFDTSRANGVTDAVVRWAKFPERNRQGITDTLQRLKQAAEADATQAVICRPPDDTAARCRPRGVEPLRHTCADPSGAHSA